mgnify:CR=1 FL=1
MLSVIIVDFTIRIKDDLMSIYFKEITCDSEKIISDSFFNDIPFPKFGDQDKFICYKPYAGNNNTQIIAGPTTESKKDTEIQLFYFYLETLKVRIFIPISDYEKIVNSKDLFILKGTSATSCFDTTDQPNEMNVMKKSTQESIGQISHVDITAKFAQKIL